MKILLINPPIRENEPPRHIPIGLGIIANVLLDKGHEVKILDINAERLSKPLVREKIDLKNKYDIIGAGGLITTYKYLKWLIPELKKYNPTSKIIIGGGVITENLTLLLNRTPADIAVIGEGEITMSEIASAIENKKSLSAIKGIAYKDADNRIKINPPGPLVKDLDSFPFPAYQLFPMDIYIKNVAHASVMGKKSEISIITTRGCPYNCNYCFHIFGRGARSRSVDNVIKEIKYLIETYKVESFLILDETFTINKNRVFEFCDKLLLEKINIPWSCYCRVNLVDLEMFQKMKQSGCYRVGYGIESGSQKILDNMNKKVTVEQAKEAIKVTRKAGLSCNTTFMFGYPGESLDTINETVCFCREMLLRPSFFFTTPYPETELYREFKEKIIKKYGDEENFIEVLGDASDFTINLTDFSDEELFKLRDQSTKKLRKISFKKYPEYIYILYKRYGLFTLLRHLFQKRYN
ncbi:B12-binding domain-containing radical SAM protein [Planctomycetota bacterium]